MLSDLFKALRQTASERQVRMKGDIHPDQDSFDVMIEPEYGFDVREEPNFLTVKKYRRNGGRVVEMTMLPKRLSHMLPDLILPIPVQPEAVENSNEQSD